MPTPNILRNPVREAVVTVRAFVQSSLRAGQTKAEIARRARLHEKSIRRIDGADWNPRADTLEALHDQVPAGWKPGDPLPGDGPGASVGE